MNGTNMNGGTWVNLDLNVHRGTRHINDDSSAVPLQLRQLRGPGSHMAIGLPSGKERGGDASASSAGRGRGEGVADAEGGRGQSSTSDALRHLMNQDVALVSSPGKAPFDHLIRKRLQMQVEQRSSC